MANAPGGPWPERYNGSGHLAWRWRLYGLGLLHTALPRRSRVYHGTWGCGLFQQLYRSPDGTLASLPLMLEWHLLLAVLAAVSALGVAWQPLLLALPVLGEAFQAVDDRDQEGSLVFGTRAEGAVMASGRRRRPG